MPGTGKTATVLEVVKELEGSSSDGDMPAFKFVHLNGLNLTNPQQVFQAILKVCACVCCYVHGCMRVCMCVRSSSSSKQLCMCVL